MSTIIALCAVAIAIACIIIQIRKDSQLTAQWQAQYRDMQARSDARNEAARARENLGVTDPDDDTTRL